MEQNAGSRVRDVSSRLATLVDHPALPLLLIGGIALALLSTLRSGQEWDGDFALYIMNARNIVLGLPYAQTEYLFNPANPEIHPAAYPPGLPLLFAPVYAVWGLDLVKFKVLCVIALCLFLLVFHRIARSAVRPSYALCLTALVGLHPFVMASENSPASEFPFMFFCYSALWLLDRAQEQEVSRRWPAALMVMSTFAVALAYLTRSIGILLFPTASVVSLLHSRRLITPTNASLAAALTVIVLAQLAFPADIGTYVQSLNKISLHGLWASVVHYAGVRNTLFGQVARAHAVAGTVLGVTLLALAVVGFLDRALRRISVFEVFCVAYVAFLIIYPVTAEVSRYAMPIWPLLFLYAARGVERCVERWQPAAQWAVAAGASAVLVAVYVIQYHTMSFGEIPNSVTAAQSEELFTTIEQRLPPGARVLARKPTIIGLFTGHQSSCWPETFSDDELWSYLRARHIDYVIQDLGHLGVRPTPVDPLDTFIERNRAQLRPVFRNDWFNVYVAEPLG